VGEKQTSRKAFEARHVFDLGRVRACLRRRECKAAARERGECGAAMAGVRAALADQDREMRELEESLDAQRRDIEASGSRSGAAFAEMEALLSGIDDTTARRNVDTDGQAAVIRTEVADQIQRLRAGVDAQIEEEAVADAKRCAEMESDSAEPCLDAWSHTVTAFASSATDSIPEHSLTA